MSQIKQKIGMFGKQRSLAILAMLSLFSGLVTPQKADAKSMDSFWSLLNKLGPTPALADFTTETGTFPVADDREPVKVIDAVVTGYNSVPGQTDDTPCITANGHDLCKQYEELGMGDTIAANGLKFGTRVRFPELYGDKEFVVRDRMNARYGYGRVDVWLPTIEEARTLGVRSVKMEIYN